MFQFKQFTIHDDRCAMKVGTDGVLLGAWADVPHTIREQDGACPSREPDGSYSPRVLDVGAGCGLISIMLAQRFAETRITALELDTEAAAQARENVENSPFASQIEVLQGDFMAFSSTPYDAVVSNPPFFEEDLLPPDASRANARHTAAGLTFENLVKHSAELLTERGALFVIIPKSAQTRFHALCNREGFSLVHATDVRTVIRKDPKRVMLHFVKGATASDGVRRDEIVLMESGKRSEAYAQLCREFYL